MSFLIAVITIPNDHLQRNIGGLSHVDFAQRFQ